MYFLAEAFICLALSIVSYMFVVDVAISILILLLLAGFSINLSFVRGNVFSDFTWMIALSSVVHFVLSIFFHFHLSLTVALIILLSLLMLTYNPAQQISGGNLIFLFFTLIFVGLVGVVLGLPYLPWILVSPFIEFILAFNSSSSIRPLVGLYYLVFYGLTFNFDLPLIAFSLAIFFVRLIVYRFRFLSYIWVDCALRFGLWVFGYGYTFSCHWH